MKPRKWNESQLRKAVKDSTSIRQVLAKLGLVEAGGNYVQVKNWIEKSKLDTRHFTGKGWSKGMKKEFKPFVSLDAILIKNSDFQSYKLKRRLFKERFFQEKCMLCGWAKKSVDGRIPLELDHVNGDHKDNRVENLRILCPNCHSLQSTHRGLNKGRKNKTG